jgi:DNA adenine methylase
MENNFREQKAKPFLRWAGGKNWLVKQLDEFVKIHSFNEYHEPFIGGGAIFFHFGPKNISYLNDLNSELIDAYLCVKEDVYGVIDELTKFENTEKCYYQVRAANYKKLVKKTARFIFLNQTSFNGIYRVNLNGEYNVPYGYRKKDFLDRETLLSASRRLQNANFSTGDFFHCINNVKENDLVFLDPPYTITHNNNGFFKYNAKLFSKDDQYRLSKMIDEIKNRNAYYILTNAAHDIVKEIFHKNDQMFELKRASLIGGKNALRSKYSELIVTNINFDK